MATLEEVSHCPKCNTVGDQGPTQESAKPGIRIIVFTCKNPLCRWFETGWPVSVNSDGTIPDASLVPRGPKQFDRPDDLLVAETMEQVHKYAEHFQDNSTER